MSHFIRDFRENPELKKERDAEELLELSEMATIYLDAEKKPGDLIKKLKRSGKDFSHITSDMTKNQRIK